MKCQSCGKKEATVRYMEDINGKKQEMHFCIDCAKKLGFVNFSDMFSPMFTNIPSLFGDFGFKEELKCPTCGYTFDDYSSTGLLGCPDCYDTFEDRLDKIFLKMHGKNRHIKLSNKKRISNAKSIQKDKIDKLDKLDEVASLKNELKTLVENEEYEKAAVVRDKIKKIEKNKRK